MKFYKKIKKRLGEILVEQGVINEEQLKDALQIQIKEGGLLGDIIVQKGFAKEEDIIQCISFQYGFAYLPLENYEVPQDVLAFIPKEVMERYCCIPIDRIGDTLTVAMANPLNIETIETLENITSLNIQVFISTPTDIREAIKRSYKDNV